MGKKGIASAPPEARSDVQDRGEKTISLLPWHSAMLAFYLVPCSQVPIPVPESATIILIFLLFILSTSSDLPIHDQTGPLLSTR